MDKEFLSSASNPCINAERDGDRLSRVCLASDFTKAVRGALGNDRPVSPTSPYRIYLVEMLNTNRITKQLGDSDIC